MRYDCIVAALPVQRGNVEVSNFQVLNAILYVDESDSMWPRLLRRFCRRNIAYTRKNRWLKNGGLDQVFE